MLSLTLGNVVPLIVNRYLNDVTRKNLRYCIVIICSIGFVGGVGMAIFWNHATKIGKRHYSIALYLLFLLVGACASTSNVTHYIYVSQYSNIETTCLSTGMALGSTTAGVLAILQGLVLETYGMSVSYTYLAVALLYLPALAALLLDRKTSTAISARFQNDSDQRVRLLKGGGDSGHDDCHHVSDMYPADMTETEDRSPCDQSLTPSPLHGPYATILQLHAFNASLGYGVIPSLISPICSRFQSASTVLLLATGLACTLDPIFRFFTVYRALQTTREIKIGTGILCVLAVALLVTLTLPRDSQLLTSPGGVAGLYPVLLYVMFGVSFGYINTSIFLYLKHHVHLQEIQEGYRWAGVMSQIGALVGSIVSFSLVISGII